MKAAVLRFVVVMFAVVSSAYCIAPKTLMVSNPLKVELSRDFINPTSIGSTDTITYKITNTLPWKMSHPLVINKKTNPANEFFFEDACSGIALAPKTFCLISVTFKPLTAGDKTVQLTVGGFSNNDVPLPTATATSFQGVRSSVVGSVDVEVSAQPVLYQPQPYQFKFINTNNTAITNPAISISATNGSYTTVSNTCNTPIPKGASCKVSGTYTPSNTNGTISATLQYDGGSVTAGSNTGARIIGYLEGWNTPPTAESILAAGYTHVIIAFGVFSLSNPGEIVLTTTGIEAGYIQGLQALGIKVLLAIGGAGTNIPGTTVNFDEAVNAAASPDAFQNALVASLNNLTTTQGYDGIDIDIEQGFTVTPPFASLSGNVLYLTNIITAYHNAHPAALISLVPQTANISPVPGQAYNETFSNYSGLIMNVYSMLSWVAVQNYNAGCTFGIDCNCWDTNTLTTSPDPAVADAIDLLASWPSICPGGQSSGFNDYTGPLAGSQVVIGFAAPNGSGSSDGSPPAVTSVINRAINCLRTGIKSSTSCDTYAYSVQYPNIGGAMFWDINYDATNQFASATGVYNCVVNGTC